MGSAPVFLLEAFPARPFGGNVAGVVLLESAAPDHWLRGVAADLGAPTTGFVDLASARSGEAEVRFFTPRQEIAACGYVTVAIATVLHQEGLWATGPAVVLAAGGHYRLLLDVGEGGGVQMQQQLAQLRRRPALPDLAPLLGPARPAGSLAPVIAGTGLRHLLVPVANVADLAELPMRAEEIARLSRQLRVDTIGVFAIAGNTDSALQVRMRDLCAGIGAVEEAASGTTTGSLALALADAGLLNRQRSTLQMLMGVEMGRPSQLGVNLDFHPEHPDRAVLARLHGYASRVLTGTIEAEF